MSDFKKAVAYTIQNEGGYSEDAQDPGGPTNWGITHDDLDRFRGKPSTIEDVKSLTYEEAVQIYRNFYWSPLALDEVKDDDVATALFDIGFNRGIRVAIKYAQQALKIASDGVMGPHTQDALNAIPKNVFLARFISLTQSGYCELVAHNPTRLKFLSGWTTRAMRILSLMEGVVL